MPKFTGQITKSVTSTSVGVGSLENPNTGANRLLVLEFLCGSDAAALGTSNFRWELQRSTTAATGTGVNSNPLDPSDTITPNCNLKSNLSANGTLTSGAIMLTIAMSEQATVRFVANPGSEIIVPATGFNGIHFMTPVCGNNPSTAAQVTWGVV